ncbi:hypothetical protein R1sor_023906 [Riccia sorocarpa]|uniref:Uncharacterized protein n=1 Tax=Riccia sorocarpa TaxID=122646 RepID=A0ABD3GS86_9MARC
MSDPDKSPQDSKLADQSLISQLKKLSVASEDAPKSSVYLKKKASVLKLCHQLEQVAVYTYCYEGTVSLEGFRGWTASHWLREKRLKGPGSGKSGGVYPLGPSGTLRVEVDDPHYTPEEVLTTVEILSVPTWAKELVPELFSVIAPVLKISPAAKKLTVQNPQASLLWDPSKDVPNVVTLDVEGEDPADDWCRLQFPVRFLDLKKDSGSSHYTLPREGAVKVPAPAEINSSNQSAPTSSPPTSGLERVVFSPPASVLECGLDYNVTEPPEGPQQDSQTPPANGPSLSLRAILARRRRNISVDFDSDSQPPQKKLNRLQSRAPLKAQGRKGRGTFGRVSQFKWTHSSRFASMLGLQVSGASSGMSLPLVNVYNPVDAGPLDQNWRKLLDSLPGGKYFFLGDWNVVEDPVDSSFKSNRLDKRETVNFFNWKLKFCLHDVRSLGATLLGPKYTRWQVRQGKFIWSTLD